MSRKILLIAVGLTLMTSCEKTENGELLTQLFIGNVEGMPGEKPSIPQNGLVAWYPFDADTKDASGNGHDGTINGKVSFTSDRKGNANAACYFPCNEGSGIVVPHDEALVLDRFTINAWVYSDSAEYNYGCIVHKGNMGAGTYFMGINYLVASVTQGELNGVNLFGNDSDVPKPKVWHMLTGTVSGSTVRMYLDGELKQEGGLGGSFVCKGTDPLIIGLQYYKGIDSREPRYAFDGKIDDIRIYKRALSEKEIKALYNE